MRVGITVRVGGIDARGKGVTGRAGVAEGVNVVVGEERVAMGMEVTVELHPVSISQASKRLNAGDNSFRFMGQPLGRIPG